jgi:hypothetical protein
MSQRSRLSSAQRIAPSPARGSIEATDDACMQALVEEMLAVHRKKQDAEWRPPLRPQFGRPSVERIYQNSTDVLSVSRVRYVPPAA